MKVTSIYITEFQQFKDFKLDLTYPTGHEKEGEPLDKVCIIGQSGTGKTTILNKIFENLTEETEFMIEYNSFNIGDTINLTNYKNYNEDWQNIRSEIRKHKEEELKIRVDLSKIIESNTEIKQIQNELDKLKEWQKKQPNPIQNLANTFEPLLVKLNVKVRTEFNFETLEKLKNLELQTLKDKPISQDLWSSGAEKLIKKFIPLYVHKPKENIILIDEPENSFYPDIQNQIVNFYSSLTTNCQFFYATHSPIIASCFEPWEIVELKYNDDGYVYRELYYEGGNHVDYYKLDPRYLRWDSILKKIFDLDVEGNEEERIPQLMKLATLKGEIKKMKNNGASDGQLEAKLQEIEKLAKLLDVPVKLYEEAK